MNELVDSNVFERSFHVLEPRLRQKTEDVEVQKRFDAVEGSEWDENR